MCSDITFSISFCVSSSTNEAVRSYFVTENISTSIFCELNQRIISFISIMNMASIAVTMMAAAYCFFSDINCLYARLTPSFLPETGSFRTLEKCTLSRPPLIAFIGVASDILLVFNMINAATRSSIANMTHSTSPTLISDGTSSPEEDLVALFIIFSIGMASGIPANSPAATVHIYPASNASFTNAFVIPTALSIPMLTKSISMLLPMLCPRTIIAATRSSTTNISSTAENTFVIRSM